jgi:hypothetical protein
VGCKRHYMKHWEAINRYAVEELVRSLPKRLRGNAYLLVINLLLAARKTDGHLEGKLLVRGQVVFGRNMCEWLGVSERSHRTLIAYLISTGFMTVQTTSKGSIGTIVDIDTYSPPFVKNDQLNDEQNDQQTTSKRPANDHLIHSTLNTYTATASPIAPTENSEGEGENAKVNGFEKAKVVVSKDSEITPWKCQATYLDPLTHDDESKMPSLVARLTALPIKRNPKITIAPHEIEHLVTRLIRWPESRMTFKDAEVAVSHWIEKGLFPRYPHQMWDTAKSGVPYWQLHRDMGMGQNTSEAHKRESTMEMLKRVQAKKKGAA